MVVTEKLEGFERRTGTSNKTGKPYDFFVLHILERQKGVTGKAAVQLVVDPPIIGNTSLLPGADYELELDIQGSVLSVKAV